MSDQSAGDGPAFYATGAPSTWRDVRAIAHLPYTGWNLANVALGAAVAPRINWVTLTLTLGAFLLGVGVASHVFDELHGRPLGTKISARVLVSVGCGALLGAIGIGIHGVYVAGPGLIVFIVIGAFIVLAYNLELFGGRFHTNWGLALWLGAIPVLTSAYAQMARLSWSSAVVALAAVWLLVAQRHLSLPVRLIRRQVVDVTGTMTLRDGTKVAITRESLLRPAETALRYTAWSVMALAVGLLIRR